jgi:hypothetical protein
MLLLEGANLILGVGMQAHVVLAAVAAPSGEVPSSFAQAAANITNKSIQVVAAPGDVESNVVKTLPSTKRAARQRDQASPLSDLPGAKCRRITRVNRGTLMKFATGGVDDRARAG